MECPRCGGDMTVYRLGSHETVACDSCEYAGITVEHGSEPTVSESWTAAIARFNEELSAVEESGETEAAKDGDEEATVLPDNEVTGSKDADGEYTGDPDESDESESDEIPSAESAVEDIDVPGEGVECAHRREAIRSLYDLLRSEERATSEELMALVDAGAVDYESAEAFWIGIGRDRLATLPGVSAPEDSSSEWRFSAAAEGRSETVRD